MAPETTTKTTTNCLFESISNDNCGLRDTPLNWQNAFKCNGCLKVGHYRCQLRDESYKSWFDEDGSLSKDVIKLLGPTIMGQDPKTVAPLAFLSPLCPTCRPNIVSSARLQSLLIQVDKKLDNVLESQATTHIRLDDIENLPVGGGNPKSWAEVVKSATREASKEVQAEQVEAELRSRSIVVDNLPETDVPDATKINTLMDVMEVEATVVNVHRMGKVRPEATRPRKIKVVLSNKFDQKEMCGPEARNKLRAQKSGDAFYRVYVDPSRTSEQREKLYHLRRRARELNESGGLTGGNRWVVDRVHYRLWKLDNGLFNRHRVDTDFGDWVAALVAAKADAEPTEV